MEIFPKRAAKKERREKRGRNDLLALEPAGPPLLSKRKRERARRKKKEEEEERRRVCLRKHILIALFLSLLFIGKRKSISSDGLDFFCETVQTRDVEQPMAESIIVFGGNGDERRVTA